MYYAETRSDDTNEYRCDCGYCGAERAIKDAREVFVDVIGTEGVFYAKISKVEARRLFNKADGQLEVRLYDDGESKVAFIGRNIGW